MSVPFQQVCSNTLARPYLGPTLLSLRAAPPTAKPVCPPTRSPTSSQSALAHAILKELAVCIEAGYECRALQRSPHLVLLNEEFYSTRLRPIIARWMVLWLTSNQLGGALTSPMLIAYLTGDASHLDGVAWEPWVVEAATAQSSASSGAVSIDLRMRRLHAFMEAQLDKRSLALMNMASDWVRIFMPHTISKIDRVSYGLLSHAEFESLLKTEPHSPRSRFKLAIPFVGKGALRLVAPLHAAVALLPCISYQCALTP